MGFNTWALLPKWLLGGLVACFFCYQMGISHGRTPYKLAAKIQEARAEIIIKRTEEIRDIIELKGRQAHETLDNNECFISDVDARLLSDIFAN